MKVVKLVPFPKEKRLIKDRCPACREKALLAIGVDAEDPVIKDNVVVRCSICGTESKLNRSTLAADDIAAE